jgi:hypothetical protein
MVNCKHDFSIRELAATVNDWVARRHPEAGPFAIRDPSLRLKKTATLGMTPIRNSAGHQTRAAVLISGYGKGNLYAANV